jgi:hypothetical protein
LTVRCEPADKTYPKGSAVFNEQMQPRNIERAGLRGDWNHAIAASFRHIKSVDSRPALARRSRENAARGSSWTR